MPVIPGVNDDADNLDTTARFVRSLPGVRRLHLLPYHRHGTDKRERLSEPLGQPASALDAPPAAAGRSGPGTEISEALQDAVRRMRAAGLETHVGG